MKKKSNIIVTLYILEEDELSPASQCNKDIIDKSC